MTLMFPWVDAAWNLSRDVKHVINVDEIYENCDVIYHPCPAA